MVSSPKILLGIPSGFCFGVKRALEIVRDNINEGVYLKHPPVHNEKVTEEFVKKGAKVVETLEEIPDNSKVIFSAHGSMKSEYHMAQEKNLTLVDTTCPFVKKVHNQAKTFLKNGRKIIYIGKKDHPEALSVLSIDPDNSVLVTKKEDIKTLDDFSKVAVLTQTTLSVDDTKEIIEELENKYDDCVVKNDICLATQKRQEAVKRIAKKSDLVIVFGSKKSSNTTRLYELAKRYTKAILSSDSVPSVGDAKTIGVIAGASTPPKVINDFLKNYKSISKY